MSKIKVFDIEITKNKSLGEDFYLLELSPFPFGKSVKAGQFVHLRIPHRDILFRRAFSIFDISPDKQSIQIIYRIVGRGTTLLSQMKKGDKVSLVAPLGNGFSAPAKKETALLISGGVGMPPIYFWAKKLL